MSRQAYYQKLQRICRRFQQILQHHQITPSMTEGYDCYYNALTERMNGILKEEFLVVKPHDIHQARIMIKQAVDLYNNRKSHLALNFLTLKQVHKEKVLTGKTWPGLFSFDLTCQLISGRVINKKAPLLNSRAFLLM